MPNVQQLRVVDEKLSPKLKRTKKKRKKNSDKMFNRQAQNVYIVFYDSRQLIKCLCIMYFIVVSISEYTLFGYFLKGINIVHSI